MADLAINFEFTSASTSVIVRFRASSALLLATHYSPFVSSPISRLLLNSFATAASFELHTPHGRICPQGCCDWRWARRVPDGHFLSQDGMAGGSLRRTPGYASVRVFTQKELTLIHSMSVVHPYYTPCRVNVLQTCGYHLRKPRPSSALLT
jgi:hypothetical protein